MNCKVLFVAAILLISLPFKGNDAAGQKKKNSSITIVGSVFCDTCFRRKFSTRSYFLPGVWVAIKCYTGKPGGSAALGTNGQTDSHGVFRITLPFSFDSEKEIQTCSAQLLRSSSASCNVPSIKRKSHFAIKSKMNNNYVYSAGPLSYRPARFPALCHKDQRIRRRNTEWRPSTVNSLKSNSNSSKFEFPPIPPFPFPPFPPISLPFPPISFWPPFPSPYPPPPPPNPIGGLPPLFPPQPPLTPPPPPPNPIGGLPPLFPPPPPPTAPPNPIGGLPPLFPPPPPLIPLIPPPPPNSIGGLPPLFPPPPPLLPLFPPPPPPNPIGGLPPLLPLSRPPPPPNPIGGLPPLSPPPPLPNPIGGLPPLSPLSPPPPPLP